MSATTWLPADIKAPDTPVRRPPECGNHRPGFCTESRDNSVDKPLACGSIALVTGHYPWWSVINQSAPLPPPAKDSGRVRARPARRGLVHRIRAQLCGQLRCQRKLRVFMHSGSTMGQPKHLRSNHPGRAGALRAWLARTRAHRVLRKRRRTRAMRPSLRAAAQGTRNATPWEATRGVATGTTRGLVAFPTCRQSQPALRLVRTRQAQSPAFLRGARMPGPKGVA